jgi:hypothetical protein
MKNTWKVDKTLIVCSHGLSVYYDINKYASALPYLLCGHFPFQKFKTLKTIKQVIAWVETIRQPQWFRSFRLGKYNFSIVKYP